MVDTNSPEPDGPPSRHDDTPTVPPSSGGPTSIGKLFERREVPQRIGPYRIVHQIGHGGMGLVYLAVRDDDQFHKRVALKVVKRGMDTDDILRRFELERQLLAAMNHPNIARLIDGGATEDGRPYFAMEYIEGKPIDEYCDHESLPIPTRLRLFQQVCQAVHYAHANLVVHRDLKPGNILVTKEGVPKLLDFGIAKLLNPEITIFEHDPTGTAVRLMTPEYASPEQVRGDALTTASDVYALGVLLYELLTGHPPYRLKSRIESEIRHMICDVDPEKPSTAVSRVEEVPIETPTEPGKPTTRTIGPDDVGRKREAKPDRLRRLLAGDIDNIVMMALRKEPRKRYTSAQQFAEDIERHLDGMPVIARPATPGYRFGKFVKRNKGAVTAVAAVIIALLIGMVATLLMAAEAGQQRNLAVASEHTAVLEKQAAQAERDRFQSLLAKVTEVSEKSAADFEVELRRVEASSAARDAITKVAQKFFDLLLATDPDPALDPLKATVLFHRAKILGGDRAAQIGEHQQALKSHQEALAIRKRVFAANPNLLAARVSLAASHREVADLMGAVPGFSNKQVAEEYENALKVCDNAPSEVRSDRQLQQQAAAILQSLADVYRDVEDGARVSDALRCYERSILIREKLYEGRSDDPAVMRSLDLGRSRMAYLLYLQGKHVEALAEYQKSLQTRKQIYALDSNPRTRRQLAWGHYYVGMVHESMKSFDDAATEYGHSQSIMRRAWEAEPTGINEEARTDLAALAQAIAGCRLQQSRLEDAERSYAEGLALLNEIDPAKRNEKASKALGRIERGLAAVAEQQGRLSAAREHAKRSFEVFDQLAAGTSDSEEIKTELAESESVLKRLNATSDATPRP